MANMLSLVRRTTIILWALLLFLAGIAVARAGLSIELICPVLLAGFGVLIRKKFRTISVTILLASCFLFGIFRGSQFMNRLKEYDSIYKKPIVITGTVVQDGAYGDHSQLDFVVDHVVIRESNKKLAGQISVSGFGASMVYRGDRVEVSGKIFPIRGGKQGSMQYSTTKVLDHHEDLISKVRHRFIAGVFTALPEPLGSFALGLLIGQRSTLPSEVTLALTAAGLTHIVAVSGYNLTIIIDSVKKLIAKKSRYQAVIFSLSLIFLFVLLVGNSPSIFRAAMVSGLSIVAWYYGRKIRPMVLIALVAALTAGYYPIYIWSDISWYLSFLAFFGVLVIAPLLVKKFSKKSKPPIIVYLLAETLAAQVMTMPIILYVFGQMSLFSIFANLLVVPFVPLAMLLSLFAGLAGMLFAQVSGIIALPAKIVLAYMLDVAKYFSNLPHSIINYPISNVMLLCIYALIGIIVIILTLKNKPNDDIITDKKESF